MPEAEPMGSDDTLRVEAEKRARSKLDFFKHLATYALVIGVLCAINLVTGPEYLWFLWPASGWGVGLLAHAIHVFAFPDQLLRRMTERELRSARHEAHTHR